MSTLTKMPDAATIFTVAKQLITDPTQATNPGLRQLVDAVKARPGNTPERQSFILATLLKQLLFEEVVDSRLVV